MSESELKIYFEERKRQFTQPEVLVNLEKMVNEILQNTEFTFSRRIVIIWTFELLCFTIETKDGRAVYLKLLQHIAPFLPNITEKYWEIFDTQEKMIYRYQLNNVK
ncbi:MAG: hypothetical protein LBT25_10140 [Candidatus Symbiothrix sp.]|jgi:hypothetical protein|nr:hypothetical protein [Candidatus Symbiothrix sp.]